MSMETDAHLRRGWSIWTLSSLRDLASPLFPGCAVAMGTFDGVHLGHREILARAAAAGEKLVPIALTFDRHPAETVAPGKGPRLITPFEQRMELIGAQGISHVVAVQFDRSFAALPADRFLEEIVARALGARLVVVGYNFRFGKDAVGDTALLATAARKHGFDVRVVAPVRCGGEHVSSTRIRTCLASGRVEEAAALLGRSFSLSGTVIAGDARGRTLGYPTANLGVDERLAIPGDGVYVTQVSVAGTPSDQAYPALTVVGTRPSFGGGGRTVESFLLDFDGDLYGRSIDVTFRKRLRSIVSFDSAAELTAQIRRDVAAAYSFFGIDAAN